MSQADLEILYKIGEQQGKRDEEWMFVPGTNYKLRVSTFGRCTTPNKNKPHFGYFEKDRKSFRVRWNGVWYNVLKQCKQLFPKDKWDFVDPFWD